MIEDIRSMKKTVRLLMCSLFLLLLVFSANEVKAGGVSGKCKVTFGNASGVVSNTVLRGWCKTVDKDTIITLPTSNVNGYKSYWIVKTTAGDRRYAMGARVKITRDITFCLTRYKLYTVKFYTSDGSACYTKLTKQLIKGQAYTLPTVAGSSTKRFTGWSTAKNTHTPKYTPGKRITCSGNTVFYVSYKPRRTVRLYTCEGTLYKTLVYDADTLMTFPSVISDKGMVLGWTTTKNTHQNPTFYCGEHIPYNSNSFYMVDYPASSEVKLTPDQLRKSEKYQNVYIVGDSRSARSVNLIVPYVNNVYYIAKGGMGLSWFKSGVDGEASGYNQLLTSIKKHHNYSDSRRNAIIFNLGANDLKNYNSYIATLNKIAPTLHNSYKSDLYFMSVNPVNDAMHKEYLRRCGVDSMYRSESLISAFNRNVRYGLDPEYFSYIDCVTYLRRTGWISYYRMPGNIPDGLHYSDATSQKIYNYIINIIER